MAATTTTTFTQQATAAITHEIAKPPSKKEETRRKLVAQLADYNVTVGNPMTAKIGDLRGLLKDSKKKAKSSQKQEEKQEKPLEENQEDEDEDLDEDIAGLLSELEVTAKELGAETKEPETEKVKLSKDEKRALLLEEAESLQMATEPLEDEGLGAIRKAITARKKELKQEKKMKASLAKEEKKRKKDMKKVLREVVKVAKKKTKTMKKNKLGKRQQIKNELVESIMGFVNPDEEELNFEPAVLQEMSTKDLRKKLKELEKANAPSKEEKAFQRKVVNFINKEKKRRASFGLKIAEKFGLDQAPERMNFLMSALEDLKN